MPLRHDAGIFNALKVGGGTIVVSVINTEIPSAVLPQGAVPFSVVGLLITTLETVGKRGALSFPFAFVLWYGMQLQTVFTFDIAPLVFRWSLCCMNLWEEGWGRGRGASAEEVGLEARVNRCVGQVPLTIQHFLFGIVFLTVKVKALSLDIFKLVMLCAEHVDVSYDSGIPKVIEGIINNKAGGAAGIKDGMVSVLDTWMVEVGGRIRACMEGGAIDGLVFAFCSLIDNDIVD